MKRNFIITIGAGIFLACLLAGCEGNSNSSKDSSSLPNDKDELNISAAVMLGPHKAQVAQNATITREMNSSDVNGSMVSYSFEQLNWPVSEGCDGGCYVFWELNGQAVGGLFDAHGAGQTVKSLENIYGGYLDGKRPAKGQTVYFAFVNLDGTERTNVKKSVNPW